MESKNTLLYNARATYYPQPDGSLKLGRVQVFDRPRFHERGWEDVNKPNKPDEGDIEPPETPEKGEGAAVDNLKRAARRAKRNAFDIIMSNPHLDCFATFTYAPDRVDDKTDWDECYPFLKNWLSNGVQRRDLAYIAVPELTKAGDIHFHLVCNSDAVSLEKARHPKSGRLIKHHGDQVYNITNWGAGFSTAQIIQGREGVEDARTAVSKYIFKYMGKNLGARIGGRYFLHGGALQTPGYVYGDGVEEFSTGEPVEKFEVDLGENGKYWEYSFV